ncbi:MAG: hypothetical protein KatS3mg055_2308 [Chloroflexus sp.]|nr:MAG: hypothetical protein KatS3mg055_2308 [Chloroflexus sp.]
MLSRLPPEQQAELLVLAQVVPLLQQGVRLLRQSGITAAERGRLAGVLEHAATQAEAGETGRFALAGRSGGAAPPGRLAEGCSRRA